MPFVTLNNGGWDHHSNIFPAFRNQGRSFEAVVATLIVDLDQRGMLDSTLVLVLGEFGRTPQISTLSGSTTAGRDHWSTAGVATMGGGGVRMGQVIGATNAQGEVVVDNPVRPQDLAATIYQALGVPLNTWYRAQDGRPIELVPTGRPVRQLIG